MNPLSRLTSAAAFAGCCFGLLALAHFSVSAAALQDRTCAGVVDSAFNAPATPNGWGLWPPWAPTPITGISVQADSKVVISGGFDEVQGIPSGGIARLNANGVIDVSYIADPADATNHAIARQSDGRTIRIVDDAGVALARDDTNGMRDPSFVPVLPSNFVVRALAVDAADRIIVAGGVYSIDSVAWVQQVDMPVLRLLADGSLDTSFATNTVAGLAPNEWTAGATVAVYDTVVDPAGFIYFSGFFTTVNGESRADVARLNPDGTLDHLFVPDMEICTGWDETDVQTVSALALAPDGKLVIGGMLGRMNGLARTAVARLHTAAGGCVSLVGLVETDQAASETNGAVHVTLFRAAATNTECRVSYAPGYLDAFGGYFSSAAAGADYLAGTNTVVFAPGETTKSVSVPIVDDVQIESSENFFINLVSLSNAVTLNGHASTWVTIWDDDSAGLPGTCDATFNISAVNGPVTRLAMHTNSSFIAAGSFTEASGQPRTGLARFGFNGTLDPAFAPTVDGPVADIAVDPEGRILLGGSFALVNGAARAGIARLHPDGTLDASFNADVRGGPVEHVVICQNGQVLVAGTFGAVGDATRHALARLNTDGTLDASFDIGDGLTIRGDPARPMALAALANGRVLIGGWFDHVNGTACGQVVRLNANGAMDPVFSTVQLFGWVPAMRLHVLPDGRVFVGGSFYTPGMLGGSYGLCRLNGDGTRDATFPMVAGGSSSIIVQPDGKIILSGERRLLPDASPDLDYFLGIHGNDALLLPDGDLIVGGSFTSVNQQPVRYLTRVHGGDSRARGPGQVCFASATWDADQGAPSVTLQVQRKWGAAGPVTLDYVTFDGTALAGREYVAQTGSVSFADNDLAPRTIVIPLLANPDAEGILTFTVILTNIVGADAGNPSVATVQVRETNTVIRLDPLAITVSEKAGAVAFQAHMSGWSSRPVTAAYLTRPVTAVGGHDYVAASGQLPFGTGPWSTWWFQIPIIDNNHSDGPRQFVVYIDNVTGGAVLHRASSQCVVTIIDDETQPAAIVTQPLGSIAMAGSAVDFLVVATGPEPLSYFWSKDGERLPGTNGALLHLSCVRTNDAGSYTVAVSNEFGGTLSQPASLVVLPGITLVPEPADSTGTNAPAVKVVSPRDLVIKVETSTNLVDWVTYCYLTNSNGRARFHSEPGTPPRFYRGSLSSFSAAESANRVNRIR